jgi:diguanylate cyclase (GGDEF)-like protein/PAS domain S-box-containing protein
LKQPRKHPSSATRYKRSLWALPAFGLLLIAALWTATWLQLQATERGLINAATRDTENLAAEFEEYTRRTIKDADRTALLVKHEFGQHDTVDLPALIQAGLIEATGAVVVNIADAKGNVVARSQPAAPFNMADREFFRLHAERDTGLLDISKPVASRMSGRPTILLSRRLNRADGSFAGIVLLSVRPEYFMQFYQEGELGKRGSLGLLGLDGIFRARRVGDDATSLSNESGGALVARAKINAVGHYEARSEIDHVARIVAYRKLADYPFIVKVARATDEALGDFYKSRNNYLIAAVGATIVILVFFSVVTALALRLQRRQAELKLQRRFLETLVDNVPSGISVRSMLPGNLGQYVLWNESNALAFGTKSEDALGRTVQDLMTTRDSESIADLDRQLLASPMVQEVVQVRDIPGKGRRICHMIRAPIFGAQGGVEYIMTSATDITEERARTDELRLASKVFETTPDGIMMSDAEDRTLMINAAFSKLTGYDADEIVGKILAESPFHPIDPAASDARMERLHRDGFVTGEVARFRKDGTPLSLWVTASCVRNADGSIRNYVRVFTDISLLKETQRKLEQLASIDQLTGLPNRRLLHDRLEQAARRAQRSNEGMAVMFIDLDGLKKVNDTLGHSVGDLLLQEAASRLQKCIRLSDSVGRLGGDEFAIVLEDARDRTDAAEIGERIVAAFALPFVLDGHRVTTSASVGIAIYPDDGSDAITLLKNADAAMYKAKQAGHNQFSFYSRRAELAAAIG